MSEQPARAPDPASPTQLRELFRRHGFRPRRALGQTFLVDSNIVRLIVSAAELTGDETVLEIGAGAGAVTRALVEAAGQVVAIEIDPKLVAILGETVGDRAEVLPADVLALSWQEVFSRRPAGRWIVVANLPYAITGPAILRLLEARERVERMVIMVQQEVANRLTAAPGGRSRGLLSVLSQAAWEVAQVRRVARTCFWPQPRVDSAVLTLRLRRPQPVPEELEPAFRKVVRAGFATRRKTLANALSHARDLGLSKQQAQALLRGCGVDPERRAETLTGEEFRLLAEALAGSPGAWQ